MKEVGLDKFVVWNKNLGIEKGGNLIGGIEKGDVEFGGF